MPPLTLLLAPANHRSGGDVPHNEIYALDRQVLVVHAFLVLFDVYLKNIEIVWRSLSLRASVSPKVWSDAYLASFAQSAGMDLVTFDQDFRQYQGIHSDILI